MTIEERVEKLAIELIGTDIGSSRSPPIRLGPALMKSHSSKEPGIAQNKSLPRLLQDEVIVFFRAESGWLGPQFATHPEMDPDPIPAGEFEQHLLSSRKGTQEPASAQLADDLRAVRPAKNPFPRMDLHGDDLLAQAGVPLPAKKFHLGEFRHRESIERFARVKGVGVTAEVKMASKRRVMLTALTS